ncbi:MAG: arylsulfatase [Bryobacteraceae bacterium]
MDERRNAFPPQSPSRRRLLQLGGLAAALGSRSAAAPVRQPNIVVVLADDQGWGDLSIHGNKNLSTPNIDSLGRDGTRFERFFVCSVCAPTRAEFLTGRYHARGGVRGVSTGQERLNTDEVTIADTFRAAGYSTGAFGKWHNGSQHPYHPNARGFDEYYGFTEGHWGQYFNAEMDHNGRLVRGRGFIIDDLTDHALRFIEENRQRPFFCYLPMNTPHSPMQVPDRYFAKFADAAIGMRNRDPEKEEIPMTRAALALCENIDWNVGRVLQQLDGLALTRDTIVIYFSDNGPNSWRWNDGMKGRKGSVDEGGLRVPFLIRWPGHIRPGAVVPQIAGAIDMLPTLTDLAAIPTISKKPLDGKSIRPLLEAPANAWPDRMIFSLQQKRVSVRTQRFRLDPAGALFDMEKDPGQNRDAAAQFPDDAARLRAAADRWSREVLPLVGEDTRPFPVGYSRITYLPARDGVPAGNIKRSARPPNCSYFTNWIKPTDAMTWDIEVPADRDFDAEVYYTCQEAGSTIELSFLGASVRCKLDQPHDPPLEGSEFQRVERVESYVKDFRPYRMGSIRLAKGRGKLTLRALDLAGKQVAEIRYIVLTQRDT